jgi:hypothetical protein
VYGRDEETWDDLTTTGLNFLVERAKLKTLTTYTELNAVLVRRTGQPGFDFDREDQRKAMGHLLGLIVERNHPKSGCMITALVRYLNVNDAGPGFYELAIQMGLLRRGATEKERERFWIDQTNCLFDYYANGGH